MYFTVNVTTGVDNEYVIDNFNPGKGLDIVQAVREELKDTSIPASLIHVDSSCSLNKESNCIINIDSNVRTRNNNCVHIPESLLNQVPYFAAKDNVTVYVSQGFLSRYQKMRVSIRKETYDNICLFLMFTCFGLFRKIERINVYYEFDSISFIQDWINEFKCNRFLNCTENSIKAKQDIRKEQKDRIAEENRVKREKQEKEEEQRRLDSNKKQLKYLAQDLSILKDKLDAIIRESK